MRRGAFCALAALALVPAVACDGEPFAPADPYPQQFNEVAAGDAHTCAIAAGGRTYCWGSPVQARLGHDGLAPECDETACRQPIPIRGDHRFTALVAGEAHTCGLEDARAFCWGFNRFGQLGDDSTALYRCADDLPFRCSLDPWPVAVGTPIQQLAAARMHTCALATDGRVLCSGWNIAGQLGRGTTDLVPHPLPQPIDIDVRFTEITTAFGHACAVSTEQAAYCWGSNEFGLLGNGDTQPRNSPVAVTGGLAFTRLAGGGHFTCGIVVGGDVYCWGWGWEGRLGTGDMFDRTEPTRTVVPEPAIGISAGQHHACAVGANGALYCWGTNHSGQLGVAGEVYVVSPQQVPLPGPVVDVSAGFAHTCAILEDARLFCWGDNSSGQLGNGSEPFRAEPVQVNP